MSMDADFSPQTLASRAEIAHVMHYWCRAVDRCDWEAVREVFHPDGYDDHGIYRGGVDGLIAWLTERHKTISRSMHMVGNMLIEFADADNALVESYSFAWQRYSPEGSEARKAIAGGTDVGDQLFDMLMSGRYVDHFQRRDGRWRILRRHVVFDNSQMLSVPANSPQLSPDWLASTRGKDDPIWAIRAKLGLA
jgi:hypothetical protein